MKFTGMQESGLVRSQVEVTIDHFGEVSLRNDFHVAEMRFIPGKEKLSVALNFQPNVPSGKMLIVEFCEVEILKISSELSLGVDPQYGYALVSDIDLWVDKESNREGFSVSTTTLEIDFFSTEMRALVVDVED